MNGTKDKEYRAISPNTVSKFIENQKVNGELQLIYNPDFISEDKLKMYANDEMYYNDGVFPYIPKEIKYLDLAVGYNKERDTMTVEVTDITFEPGKDKEGDIVRISLNEDGKYIKDENGDFTIWNIVFHLGEIVKKDLKRKR